MAPSPLPSINEIKAQVASLQRRLEELRRVGAELEAELAALEQPEAEASAAADAAGAEAVTPAPASAASAAAPDAASTQALESYLASVRPAANQGYARAYYDWLRGGMKGKSPAKPRAVKKFDAQVIRTKIDKIVQDHPALLPAAEQRDVHVSIPERREPAESAGVKHDLRCGKCGHQWQQRGENLPERCPGCGVSLQDAPVFENMTHVITHMIERVAAEQPARGDDPELGVLRAAQASSKPDAPKGKRAPKPQRLMGYNANGDHVPVGNVIWEQIPVNTRMCVAAQRPTLTDDGIEFFINASDDGRAISLDGNGRRHKIAVVYNAGADTYTVRRYRRYQREGAAHWALERELDDVYFDMFDQVLMAFCDEMPEGPGSPEDDEWQEFALAVGSAGRERRGITKCEKCGRYVAQSGRGHNWGAEKHQADRAAGVRTAAAAALPPYDEYIDQMAADQQAERDEQVAEAAQAANTRLQGTGYELSIEPGDDGDYAYVVSVTERATQNIHEYRGAKNVEEAEALAQEIGERFAQRAAAERAVTAPADEEDEDAWKREAIARDIAAMASGFDGYVEVHGADAAMQERIEEFRRLADLESRLGDAVETGALDSDQADDVLEVARTAGADSDATFARLVYHATKNAYLNGGAEPENAEKYARRQARDFGTPERAAQAQMLRGYALEYMREIGPLSTDLIHDTMRDYLDYHLPIEDRQGFYRLLQVRRDEATPAHRAVSAFASRPELLAYANYDEGALEDALTDPTPEDYSAGSLGAMTGDIADHPEGAPPELVAAARAVRDTMGHGENYIPHARAFLQGIAHASGHMQCGACGNWVSPDNPNNPASHKQNCRAITGEAGEPEEAAQTGAEADTQETEPAAPSASYAGLTGEQRRMVVALTDAVDAFTGIENPRMGVARARAELEALLEDAQKPGGLDLAGIASERLPALIQALDAAAAVEYQNPTLVLMAHRLRERQQSEAASAASAAFFEQRGIQFHWDGHTWYLSSTDADDDGELWQTDYHVAGSREQAEAAAQAFIRDHSATLHAEAPADEAEASPRRQVRCPECGSEYERSDDEPQVCRECSAALIDVGALLRGHELEGADLRGVALPEADLNGANLAGAQLEGADFTDALLQQADLYRADLRGAAMERARLTGAVLREAQLAGARLQGANLSSADLRDADLTYADLTGANLQGAQLIGARFTNCVVSPQALYKAGIELQWDYDREAYIAREFTPGPPPPPEPSAIGWYTTGGGGQAAHPGVRPKLRCARCAHEWIPQGDQSPDYCPRCGTSLQRDVPAVVGVMFTPEAVRALGERAEARPAAAPTPESPLAALRELSGTRPQTDAEWDSLKTAIDTVLEDGQLPEDAEHELQLARDGFNQSWIYQPQERPDWDYLKSALDKALATAQAAPEATADEMMGVEFMAAARAESAPVTLDQIAQMRPDVQPHLQCSRCGHEWYARGGERPAHCPACGVSLEEAAPQFKGVSISPEAIMAAAQPDERIPAGSAVSSAPEVPDASHAASGRQYAQTYGRIREQLDQLRAGQPLTEDALAQIRQADPQLAMLLRDLQAGESLQTWLSAPEIHPALAEYLDTMARGHESSGIGGLIHLDELTIAMERAGTVRRGSPTPAPATLPFPPSAESDQEQPATAAAPAPEPSASEQGGDASLDAIMAMLKDLQSQVSAAEQRNAQLRGELGQE